MWPTPDANAMNLNQDPASYRARLARLKEKHGNGNGAGTVLAQAVLGSQSTATSAPSTPPPGGAAVTSSRAASPASRSARLASASAKTTRATCGHTPFAFYESGAPLGFFENVPGLLSSGYFGTVLGDLAEAGFDAEWCVLGADDVGAPHRRKRLWILAYRDGEDAKNDAGPSQWERNSDPLNVAVKRWPTPKGSPSGPDFARMNRPESGGDDLVTAVARGGATPQTWLEEHIATFDAEDGTILSVRTGQTWATPNAAQWKGSGPVGSKSNDWDRATHRLKGEVMEQGTQGQLSPNWVSWLMGWPVGWEDASRELQWECPSASADCEHLATVRCLSAWLRRSVTWLRRLGYDLNR